MTFLFKWGCGTLLDIDPSITTATGKCIPLSGGIPHQCHLDPWYKRQTATFNNTTRSKTTKLQALQNIEDINIIDKARSEIVYYNARLSGYELELHVKQKQTQLNLMGEL